MRQLLYPKKLMFGNLTARLELLTQEQLERYRASYCGLCRSLKERHGQLGRLTLNYDLCFLVLLLDSLYEPEIRAAEGPCPAHPIAGRASQRSEHSDYAADMTIALAYEKCRDDWRDEANPLSLTEMAVLSAAYRRVRTRWPRQCAAILRELRALHELERARVYDADRTAEPFGRLLGELFVLREDRWAGTLRLLGEALGRFLYLLDACLDLEKDALLGRYNPLRRYYGRENTARFRALLRLLLSDAARAFDRLPLVQDAALLQNILCAGLWTAFDKKYGNEDDAIHGAGSL